MGNAGTDGADESRHETGSDEPGEAARQRGHDGTAGTGRPGPPARHGNPPGRSRPGTTDMPDADGAWPAKPYGRHESRPYDAGTAWRASYDGPADVAPEWPLTNENRIVETATPTPAEPAERPGRSGADRDGNRPEPKLPRHIPGDDPPASGHSFSGNPPAAGEPGPSEARDSTRAEPTGRPGRGHRDGNRSMTAESGSAGGRHPTPATGETSMLRAIGGSGRAGASDAETSLLPRSGYRAGHAQPPADETTGVAGHARIPRDADPASGFLVAQGLSAMGSDGPVFTSVSVTAELGEVVTIVGDAGTGRTALLLALAGRFKCQAGSLTVDGDARPSRIRGSVAVAWAAPAVVFEDDHTVAAVLTESALVGGVTEAEVRRCCDELRLDLDTGAAFGGLARVDQMLLALASAWASGAPVVAVDDLDAGVDDAGAARLWTAVRRIADDHRLVLATTVRAGTVGDRSLRPRPLALVAGSRRGTEPPR